VARGWGIRSVNTVTDYTVTLVKGFGRATPDTLFSTQVAGIKGFFNNSWCDSLFDLNDTLMVIIDHEGYDIENPVFQLHLQER
jgi:hypothetical protein